MDIFVVVVVVLSCCLLFVGFEDCRFRFWRENNISLAVLDMVYIACFLNTLYCFQQILLLSLNKSPMSCFGSIF